MFLILLILNITLLRSELMQAVFINECKSCEIRNEIFFNVMFSFSKTKEELVMTYILKNKIICWCHFA